MENASPKEYPELLHTVLDTTDVRSLAEFSRLLVLGVRNKDRPDGRRDAAVSPGDDASLRVETGIDVFDRDGVEIVVMKVVLARPRDLDRRAAHLTRE